jgi:hypothetical protein
LSFQVLLKDLGRRVPAMGGPAGGVDGGTYCHVFFGPSAASLLRRPLQDEAVRKNKLKLQLHYVTSNPCSRHRVRPT